MVSRPFTGSWTVMAAAAILTLTGLAGFRIATACAGPWSIALLEGGTSDYRALGPPYPVSFGGTLLVQLAVERRVPGNLALRAEAGYLGFSIPYISGLGLLRAPAGLRSPPGRTARFVPVALGIRLYSPQRAELRARGYLQFAPGLFWLRSNQRDGSFTALRPGIVAGAGVRTRLGDAAHVEWGIRYLYSGRIGEPPPGSETQSYIVQNARNWAGLNTLAFVVGVGGTP